MKKPEFAEFVAPPSWNLVGASLIFVPLLVAGAMAGTLAAYPPAVQIGFWFFSAITIGYVGWQGVLLIQWARYLKKHPEADEEPQH